MREACQAMGIKEPTKIQAECIPPILANKDVLGLAETGSGKTAAYAIPIIQKLFREPYGVFAVVLSPARELVLQTAEHFRALGARQKIRVTTVIGGVPASDQALELETRPHVVIATPGRLVELIDAKFARVHTLVFDEADRLLTPTFEDDVRAIVQVLKDRKQTLFFSATTTPALDRLSRLRAKPLLRIGHVGLPAALRHEYLLAPERVKKSYFVQLLRLHKGSAMIFVQTCRRCHELEAMLTELKLPVISLHSKMGQKRRTVSLAKFKSSQCSLLIATDVASRGLDIPSVDLVVNFDVPRCPDDYVHRAGRAGRAGRKGRAITLVTQYDRDLVMAIEARIKTQLVLNEQVKEDDVVAILNPVAMAIATAAIKRPWTLDDDDSDVALEQRVKHVVRDTRTSRTGSENKRRLVEKTRKRRKVL